MKFSENWLRHWVNPKLSSEELSDVLTMAGLEVESLEPVAPAFNNVVIAQVISLVKHPDADRLNVCQVDVGEAELLTIVCGAPNVAAGIKVPCARIGAVLPGEFTIKQAKVRGVNSFGMLCSNKELGLATDSDGLSILSPDAPVGLPMRQYLELDDKLFTLKLTPNRSDCSGIKGIAREVAALTGTMLDPLKIIEQPCDMEDHMAVQVEDKTACPLYCGRLVKGVNAAVATPVWIQRRLERSGVRLINVVVDITNYVMFELGQPMHAFDADKLSGGITVRRAKNDELLTLLNDQTIVLDEDVLVIADHVRVLAMAGIMGGADSGVDTNTKDVFLEAAFFHPDAIAGRARRAGLATDASFRFERGVDFTATREALERATQLLLAICGGHAGKITEVAGIMPLRAPINLRSSRVARVLGVTLECSRIAALLTRLQVEFIQSGDVFSVTPPGFRFDLSIEADLIEEIARLYGYDNIPALAPIAALTMLPVPETMRSLAEVKRLMVARDYQEIVSYAFIDEKHEHTLCGNEHPVALQNPIASNMSVMRSSLISGLVDALRFNLNRKQSRIRLFEAGACFAKNNDAYVQTQRVAAIACGAIYPEQWSIAAKAVDFYDVKSDLAALFAQQSLRYVAAVHPALHPGRSAQLYLHDKMIGWIGELHPNWLLEYDISQPAVWFEVEQEALTQVDVPRMGEISKFLPVRRDLAVLVDELVKVQTLIDAMLGIEAVEEVVLFDIYRGAGVESGKKSLAFRVMLQDTEKMFTDAEIEPVISKLVDVLNNLGAQLRK